MPIEGIDHVQVAMPQSGESEAREFYSGLLGLTEIPKPPELAKRGGCWFREGSVIVHLGIDHDFRPAKKAHPGFLVRDLAALVERLRAAGAQVVNDNLLPGFDRVYVFDPFGNRLELMEPTNE